MAVTGPSNRRNLTVETLAFCGALPIYNTEMIEGDSVDNGNGNTGNLKILVQSVKGISWNFCFRSISLHRLQMVENQ